jgi:GntR family transcriptional regulator/MocR family aminotransferase
MNYEPYLNMENASGPLYLALYQAIAADLKKGKLRKGERMPSIRAMARQLDLSITPVESAYQQLCAEGYLIAKAKSGYIVADIPEMQMQHIDMANAMEKQLPHASLGKAMEGQLQQQTVSRKEAGSHKQPLNDFTRTSVYLYDFHIAKNDFSFFPFPVWRRTLNAVMRDDGDSLLFYGDRQGEWGLRTEISSYLLRSRGVICEPKQVVIGAEQHLLLHYLTLMLNNGSRILAAENPCYPLIPQAFRSAGYTVVPLDIPGGGIASRSVAASSSEEQTEAIPCPASPASASPGIAEAGPLELAADILSVAPSHQFPSGRAMSAAEKLRLLEWSTSTGGCIIEDDYGGELRYRGQPIPALQGMAPDANVVYLGGMPQVLAPELCIHYMVLPKGMLPAFRKLGQQLMFEPSSPRIYQRTLEHFIREGHFERHIRRMRNVYRRKMNVLRDFLKLSFGEKCSVEPAVTGLHLVMSVTSRNCEETLTEAAKQAGVRIAPASPYTIGRGTNGLKRELLIGFGGIPEEQIEAGASALAQALMPLLL